MQDSAGREVSRAENACVPESFDRVSGFYAGAALFKISVGALR